MLTLMILSHNLNYCKLSPNKYNKCNREDERNKV